MSVKAFDLLLVSKYLNISRIECIEASGNDVYLGSSDSLILHASIEERRDNDSNVIYSSNIVCQRNIGTKRAIVAIKAASALGCLLVLSDFNLYLLDSDVLATIGSGPKMKNVLAFCVNENPNTVDPFTLEFCVGKKKYLQLCTLHEEKINILKEISLQDPPVNIAMDGKFVCVAGNLQYCVYNVRSGTSQDLFPVDPSLVSPPIKRIAKEEFLVIGPGNLGMFVTAAGTSERPPIQWGDSVLAFSYYHPYIITLTESYIRVYSLIDQQHKQTILFNGGSLMGNFDGQLYIATNSSLHCLMPKPWTSQVMTLLENESIDEAIELTEHSGGAGMTADRYISFTLGIFQRAGFIRFSHSMFQEAQEYFLKGRLDVRELLSLYPGLMPSSVSFMRAQPPLHSLADVNQAFHSDVMKTKEATAFLISFLLYVRSYEAPVLHIMEIDTALVKLYSKEGGGELLNFVANKPIHCVMEECVIVLQRNYQYAALAKLYNSKGEYLKSLEIITKLIRSELKDELFEGPRELVDVILSSSDENFVWRFADFVLDTDENGGLRMFCEFRGDLDPPKVLKCLSRYPHSRIKYLHHLISVKNVADEKYHTELILHYISEEDQHDKQGLDFTENRIRLRELLNTSNKYNPKVVLAKLQDTRLILETADVYGKINEHEKALSMLVFDLKDFVAAENYCVKHSQDLLEENKSFMYTTLLKLYLRPPSGSSTNEIELAPALELLSLHSSQLDLQDVLVLLPADWSVSITHHYLKGAIRSSQHKFRMKKMEQSLVKCKNLQQRFIYQNLCKTLGPIVITTSSICCVCLKGFNQCNFSLYPNGVLTHRECIKDSTVCPLTGKVFKIRSV